MPTLFVRTLQESLATAIRTPTEPSSSINRSCSSYLPKLHSPTHPFQHIAAANTLVEVMESLRPVKAVQRLRRFEDAFSLLMEHGGE